MPNQHIMKQLFLLFLAFTLSASVEARVLTLNNNNPSPGQYTTWSSAYSAALSGDTILVQESPTSYGSLTINTANKSLTVIGAGHKPGTIAGNGSKFDSFDVNVVGNALIRLYGLSFSISYADIKQPNTRIEKCYFGNASSGNSSYYLSVNTNNVLIKGCVFKQLTLKTDNTSSATNLTVINNYFETNSEGYCLSGMSGTGSKVFSNNIFVGVSGTTTQLIQVGSAFRNTVISNSIFYGVSPRGGGSHTDLLFSNNIVFGASDNNIPLGATGGDNLIGVDPRFVNVPAPAARPPFQYNYDYHLRSDSPGKGVASGGGDIGLYRYTGDEFSMRGEPDRPFTMSLLTDNPVIPSGGTTNVNFTIRQGDPQTVSPPVTNPVCRAKVSPTEYKNFMCYNLGSAYTSGDPFTAGYEINGGYWQWGRLTEAAPGPTGGDPLSGSITGWNTSSAPDGSWSDTGKTANDPCPAGYRVPTIAQWEAVINNNSSSTTGSWTGNSTNYSSGVNFGGELYLPAAGWRNTAGTLGQRDQWGLYWSSTKATSVTSSRYLYFDQSSRIVTNTTYQTRTHGMSIRCIAE
jgi:uncharacterized protein (TIGR02145 family)